MPEENKGTRLHNVAREFNVGARTIVEFLQKKGIEVDPTPNAKISPESYKLLVKEFSSEKDVKIASEKMLKHKTFGKKNESDEDDDSEQDDMVIIKDPTQTVHKPAAPVENAAAKQEAESKLKILGKIDLENAGKPKKEAEPQPKIETASAPKKAEETKPVPASTENTPELPKQSQPAKPKEEPAFSNNDNLKTPKVVGKIDLESAGKPKLVKKSDLPTDRNQRPAEKQNQQQHRNTEQRTFEKKPAPAVPPVVNKETTEQAAPPKPAEVFKTDVQRLTGPTVVGKIDLAEFDSKKKPAQPITPADKTKAKRKKKRKRIQKDGEGGSPANVVESTPISLRPPITKVDKSKEGQAGNANRPGSNAPRPEKKKAPKQNDASKFKKVIKKEVNEEDVQKQVKETLARLTTKTKSKGSKHRRLKRDEFRSKQQEEAERMEAEKSVIQVTEFVSVSELASLMDVNPTAVISTCMSLGLLVSINQRLDAETMSIVAEEFGYKVEFISVDVQEAIKEEEDTEEDLISRAPIVTVMGHVDHGKTSLLDFVRKANVISGEAGGITQHIGAYRVNVGNGKQITFLDTPGHEAFTAMRARGASVTDVAIIVVAADDSVMRQTKEAIAHAQAAGVPIVFAINKIDKKEANPEKIKEQLANMNFLVEDWGGKYQSQDISAKAGLNIDALLEKVLLEAEVLDLKANPNRRASGSIIESSLDKGRGYVATVLVQNGTLAVGDVIIAGQYHGRVKAMYNEHNKRVQKAGPSEPVLVLGLNGAPQAGDNFNCLETEKEAREIASKRAQLQRELGLRTQKHMTLEEIGRRIAIGNFQELNLIVKGDVDGSIEALSDSLIKLSTPEIAVNVIHKAVGQISESDITLAMASNAIIIGFQVRPSQNARKLAEKEGIEIRLSSVIYKTIDEIKAAMEGMLAPEIKEEIIGSAEIREVFKITKVGNIAGCMVKEGIIKRTSNIRLIRDGIVVFTGKLASLKRLKDDAKEVKSGYECGLNIDNFNDIKEGDIIEAFEEIEVKKLL